jgi:ATP-dependent DNA helicase RecG
MINSQQLEELLEAREADRVEVTQSLTDTDKFCEAICAFANDLPDYRQPGYLVVGVDKHGKPTGASITDHLLVNLAAHRDNGEIIPQPVMNVAKLEVGGVSVAVVEVFPSDAPPVRYKGVTRIRTGPRKAIATVEEERRLSEKRIDRARTWDARACRDATLDDLSIDLFQLSYLPNAIAREVLEQNHRKTEEQLAALRFYDTKLHSPTNAALLLFGKDSLSVFPGAYAQYVHYAGPSAADDILSERRITGDLLSVMSELDRLAQQVAESRPIRQASLKDATAYLYPPVALHELLMNAVIHRNYEGSTTPIMVNQFSDRIEIHNPGSLYGDLTKSQFPNGVSYRNPVLAEAAKILGFVNRFGRGIAIAQDEMKRNGSVLIEFPFGDNHFAAIMRARL